MSGTLHLLVRLAGHHVALPAAEVEAVIEVEAVTPIPRAPPHIAGLVALRSRVLTVVDGCAVLGQRRTVPAAAEAVVMQWEGHAYALLVDAVEDAVELDELSSGAPAAGPFAPLAQRVAAWAGGTLPVVSPALLLTPVEAGH